MRDKVINCDNEGCPVQMFEWSHQQHQSECCYKQFKCMFCNTLLSIPSLKEHLKKCSEYVEKSRNGKEGSLGVLLNYESSRNGMFFELHKIKTSFVAMYRELLVIFLREEDVWRINVITLNDKYVVVNITYWLPILSKVYEMIPTLKFIANKSIDNNMGLPTIPIDTLELEFEIRRKRDVGVEALLDGFNISDEDSD